VKRLAERERLQGRISRIGEACKVFARAFKEGIFTFEEFRGACRVLSTLIRSFDSDAGDLCLLASHAENLEQFKHVCRMSSKSWKNRGSRKRVKLSSKRDCVGETPREIYCLLQKIWLGGRGYYSLMGARNAEAKSK